MSQWLADAPANIALVKYMGKVGSENLPANSSLSYTLDHFRSFVKIEPCALGRDVWQPLSSSDCLAIHLSESAQQKFLKHFGFLKNHFSVPGHYAVQSANNFPNDCGVASSASSFAALTMATHRLALDQSTNKALAEACTLEELCRLSRLGSGSSCRSFFSPWSLWPQQKRGAEPIEVNDLRLQHLLVVVDDQQKMVSSSQAHKRVSDSLLFQGRVERAESRLSELLTAFANGQWRDAYELVWSEFWDMHALFETSRPAFGYMNDHSMKVLLRVRELWTNLGDGPLITMDAGANVHLLYRSDQSELRRKMALELRQQYRVLVGCGEII